MNLNPSMLFKIGIGCRLESRKNQRCLTLSLIYVDPKDQNIINDWKAGWKVWKLRAGDFENSIVNI
jgi:hypothetical protein